MFQKDKTASLSNYAGHIFGTSTVLLAVSDVKVKFSMAVKRMNIFFLYI